ncbi:hypothetical protein CS022_02225 [Veronia nyctiphanis]|uniref:Uncharacterized protein n=1 Tax=Veronia nyctiphanis TaxID=1278244 RepID=A0A4Q0YT60_9GAMM|nr:hypothetical protein CS022_02225 [Veronia nyctiphanis]
MFLFRDIKLTAFFFIILTSFILISFPNTAIAGCLVFGGCGPGSKPEPVEKPPTLPSAENGCTFDYNAPAFKGYSDSKSQNQWSFWIGQEYLVNNNVGLPIYNWSPDGQISVIKDTQSNKMLNFIPGSKSYRTTGSGGLPENQTSLSPTDHVVGGKYPETQETYNDGGEWLMSVFDVGNGDGRLIGFGHAEDHYRGQGGPKPSVSGGPPMAYKTFTVLCSNDWGNTWGQSEIILSDGTKPSKPEWRGIGDGAVVWDFKNNRWVAILMNKLDNGRAALTAAASYDKSAKPSSWKKWDGSNFGADPMNDRAVHLQFTDNGRVKYFNGANPSVTWNTKIQKWLMVYHAWGGDLMIAAADNLPYFEKPKVLFKKGEGDHGRWYPTIINNNGGTVVSRKWNNLYFRKWLQQNSAGESAFMGVRIRICQGSYCSE